MTEVILLKSADTQLADLHSNISVHYVEVLRHDTTQFLPQLREALAALNSDYMGILLPSQRAVTALAQCPVPHTAYFAVGTATAASLLTATGMQATIAGSQGMEQLCDQLLQYLGTARKLLYLCGDNEQSLPRGKLESAGVEVVQCVCYTTVTVPPEELSSALLSLPSPRAYVFFSPSGVQAVSRSGAVHPTSDLLAIGSSTAKALRETFGRCDGLPQEFNLAGVARLLNERYS